MSFQICFYFFIRVHVQLTFTNETDIQDISRLFLSVKIQKS